MSIKKYFFPLLSIFVTIILFACNHFGSGITRTAAGSPKQAPLLINITEAEIHNE